MIISVKATKIKELQKIEKRCRWHRKFVWWPVKLKCSNGMEKIAWLTFVHRKAKLEVYQSYDRSRYYSNFHYQYLIADEAFMHALEHSNELAFSSSESIEYYHKLKEICNE